MSVPSLAYTRAGEEVTSLEEHKGVSGGNLRRLNSRRRKTKRKKLRERDGDLCWICRRAMDFKGSAVGPEFATIDHVLPRSQGGSHDIDNLRLAHRRCNLARADGRMTPLRAGEHDLEMG